MNEVQPTDLHWHLAFVCTRPENQGHGLGTALIRDGVRRCDAAGHPAYLEATSDRNRTLYERLGFHVIGVRCNEPDRTAWRTVDVGHVARAGLKPNAPGALRGPNWS